MPTWVQWLEHGLSIAGLVAIGTWAYTWLSHFSQKQRELSEIDREIRAALREALDTQRELRSADRATYEHQLEALRSKAEEIAAVANSRAKQLDRYERLLQVVQLGTSIATTMAKLRTEELLESAKEATASEAVLLTSESGISAEVVRAAFTAQSPPDAVPGRLLFLSIQQLQFLASMRTAGKISAAVVPMLLEEFSKNPEASLKQLQQLLGSRIREGKLDDY